MATKHKMQDKEQTERQPQTDRTARSSEGQVAGEQSGHSLAGVLSTSRVDLGSADLLALQRTMGNQAVQRLLAREPGGQGDRAMGHDPDLPARGNTQIQRVTTKPKPTSGGSMGSKKNKLEKGVRKGDGAAVTAAAKTIYATDPNYYVDLLGYKLDKHKNNKTKYDLYIENTPGADHVLRIAWQRRIANVVKASAGNIGFFSPTDTIQMAQDAPKFFMDNIVQPLKNNPLYSSFFRTLIKIGGVRDALRAGIPVEWQQLAATIPMLSIPEAIHQDNTTNNLNLTAEQIADRIFDDIVNNRGIDVGYFTNNLDHANTILGGSTPEEKQARITRAAVDATKPSKPSTQCDNLMKVLQEVISLYPGLTPVFGITIEPQALLTVPLNTLHGGLIPNSFGGNVINATGGYTNQIFFTGVVGADNPNSHTWNVVDGKAYDTVLGTKGDEVAASKQGSFKMTGPGVWQDTADPTKTITQVTGTRAAPNTMGFGTAYRRSW